VFSKFKQDKRFATVAVAIPVLALTAWGLVMAVQNTPRADEPQQLSASGTSAINAQQAMVVSALHPIESSKPAAAASAVQLSDDDFRRECIHPLRNERYNEAIGGCTRFKNDERLGAKAHAALAALYSTRGYRDHSAAIAHAERSASLGDPRGKFMSAIQMLAGHSPRPFDLNAVRQLLQDASAQGVTQADLLLDRIEQSEKCRQDKHAFKLLNAPIFCMFRPEISHMLAEHGMTPRSADLQFWVDTWRPGDVLPGASSAELLYDRSPDDEMLRLARLTYRIDAISATDQLPLMSQALREKYGAPTRGKPEPAPGGMAVWQTESGVEITLSRASDGSIELRYNQPPRFADRETHLSREDQLSRQARVRRQQIAL